MRVVGVVHSVVLKTLLGTLAVMGPLSAAQLVSPNSPGSIAGTVVDQTGAVIPQAAVTVSRPHAEPVTVQSDGLGQFTINSLAPGSYNVEAKAPGFRAFFRQGVRVAAGAAQT